MAKSQTQKEEDGELMFTEIMEGIFSQLEGMDLKKDGHGGISLNYSGETLVKIKETDTGEIHGLNIAIPDGNGGEIKQFFPLDRFWDPDYDPRRDIMALGNIVFSGMFGGPVMWTMRLRRLLYTVDELQEMD